MKEAYINAYFCRVSPLSPYKGNVGEIENSLRTLQEYVGGDIQTVPLTQGLLIICNDDGKILGLPVNRAITDGAERVYDIVMGNALVVRTDGEEFASVTEADISIIEKYLPAIRLRHGNIVEFLETESLPEMEG